MYHPFFARATKPCPSIPRHGRTGTPQAKRAYPLIKKSSVKKEKGWRRVEAPNMGGSFIVRTLHQGLQSSAGWPRR